MSPAHTAPTSPAFLHAHHHDLPFSRPPTPKQTAYQLGFVGLGAMGYPMARNLANHDHSHPAGANPVLVFNRSREKSEKLLAELGPHKIAIADSLAHVAKECDVILTSLASDDVVRDTYVAFRDALKDVKIDKPKIFIETSTSLPSLVGELDQLISSLPHAHLITCPVFGPPAAAEKAQLILVMSGNYRSKKEAAYLLVPAIGRRVFDLGGNLEKAPTFKLIGNSMILGFIEVMAEAMTMSEKSGLGSDTVLHLIKDMFPAAPLLNYGTKLVQDEFDGSKGFSIDGGIKDAQHIRHLTSEHNCPMPVIDIAHQNLLTARAIHERHKSKGKAKFETLDWSALIAGPRVAAGLNGFDQTENAGPVRED